METQLIRFARGGDVRIDGSATWRREILASRNPRNQMEAHAEWLVGAASFSLRVGQLVRLQRLPSLIELELAFRPRRRLGSSQMESR